MTCRTSTRSSRRSAVAVSCPAPRSPPTSLRPGIAVHGAEPANADDAARSLASGRVEPAAATMTIADGLRTTLAPRTLAALRAHVASIGLATEDGIVHAMRMIWERMKIVVEPSSAVPLAACSKARSTSADAAWASS